MDDGRSGLWKRISWEQQFFKTICGSTFLRLRTVGLFAYLHGKVVKAMIARCRREAGFALP